MYSQLPNHFSIRSLPSYPASDSYPSIMQWNVFLLLLSVLLQTFTGAPKTGEPITNVYVFASLHLLALKHDEFQQQHQSEKTPDQMTATMADTLKYAVKHQSSMLKEWITLVTICAQVHHLNNVEMYQVNNEEENHQVNKKLDDMVNDMQAQWRWRAKYPPMTKETVLGGCNLLNIPKQFSIYDINDALALLIEAGKDVTKTNSGRRTAARVVDYIAKEHSAMLFHWSLFVDACQRVYAHNQAAFTGLHALYGSDPHPQQPQCEVQHGMANEDTDWLCRSLACSTLRIMKLKKPETSAE